MDSWQYLEQRILVLGGIEDLGGIKLRKIFAESTFSAGRFLIRQGEIADRIFFLCEGIIKTSFVDENGREYIKKFVEKGEFFGPYYCFLEEKSSSVTLEVLEDCRVLSVSRNVYRNQLENWDVWQKFTAKYHDLLYRFALDRERALLSLTAGQRYNWFMETHPELSIRVKRKDIALYLGITPESLSRVLRTR